MTHFLPLQLFNIQDKVEASVNEFVVPKNENWYLRGNKKLTERWRQTVQHDGLYIESEATFVYTLKNKAKLAKYCSTFNSRKYITDHDFNKDRRSRRSIVANIEDCDIVVNEFELQSRYYVHFQINTFRKGLTHSAFISLSVKKCEQSKINIFWRKPNAEIMSELTNLYLKMFSQRLCLFFRSIHIYIYK